MTNGKQCWKSFVITVNHAKIRFTKGIVYCFWSRNQGNDVLIDQWIKCLRMKAKLCEFGDPEDIMIIDKIVFSVNDERVKERLLRESDLSLSKALDVCRAAETTRAQLKAMTSEGKSEAKVNLVKQRSQTFSKGSHAGGRGNRDRVVRWVSRGHRLHRGISNVSIAVDRTQQNPARRMETM